MFVIYLTDQGKTDKEIHLQKIDVTQVLSTPFDIRIYLAIFNSATPFFY